MGERSATPDVRLRGCVLLTRALLSQGRRRPVSEPDRVTEILEQLLNPAPRHCASGNDLVGQSLC
jgi:hypothetical protein